MKKKYEYEVVVGNDVVSYAATRQEARAAKNTEKSWGFSAKIVQKVYVLQEEKVVR